MPQHPKTPVPNLPKEPTSAAGPRKPIPIEPRKDPVNLADYGNAEFWSSFFKNYLPDRTGGPEFEITRDAQRIYGKGVAPVSFEVQRGLTAGSLLQGLGIPSLTGDIGQFIQGRIGYLPTYWEDPHRIGKWFHKLKALPDDAPVPEWIDRDKLNAAYKYFESRNDGAPWWDWKFLHPSDPSRSFLQGFTTPPPEALFPEELLYTPGQIAEAPRPGPPLPGTPEYDAQDIWQKVLNSVFGSGPSILEPYPTERGGILGAPLRSGAATFARGFGSGAPLGALYGGIAGAITGIAGGPLGIIVGGVGGALVAGALTGTIGGTAGVGLETIQRRRDLGTALGGDNALEWMLNNMLAGIQAPAEIVERGFGVAGQLISSTLDPEKYGPVSEVFGNLSLIEVTAAPGEILGGVFGLEPGEETPREPGFKLIELVTTRQGQAFLVPYLGGPAGQQASLAYEQAGATSTVITHGFEYLSTAISKLPFLDDEVLQLNRPDEIWDLGATEPRKIGDNTEETHVALWLMAQSNGRRELMTRADAAPRDIVLEMGARYGISGILSDLLLQGILDPWIAGPRAEIRIARGIGRGKGLGGKVGKLLNIGEIEQSYIRQAVEMIDAEGRLVDIRGLKSAARFARQQYQVGGVELVRTFANILRTGSDAYRIEKISGMTPFARWLGGVTPEGKLKIALEPTGIFGKLFNLTPKSRATKFLFTSHDVVKIIMQMGDTPEAILKIFESMTSGDAAAWQKAGLGILGTPDGHFPVLAARDFKVSKLQGFLELWKDHTETRSILNTVKELYGHEDVRQTVRLLRDHGDAAWGKLAEVIKKGVGEGSEQAIQLQRLIDGGQFTQKTFDAAVKGSLTGAVPLTVDHFRWLVYDAWLSHITDWVIKAFNVKIEPMMYRLSNALKQGASIVLLDGNPGYLYANFWNNVSTAAVDGVFGFHKIEKIVAYFESELGMSPSRLEQAFGGPAGVMGEAGLIPRDEMAKLTLPEAIEKGVPELQWVKAREAAGFQKISEKTMGQGAIKLLDRALGSLRQKTGGTGIGKWSPLVMSRLSGAVERLQGANAFYSGSKSWLNRAWRRGMGFDKMPPAIEAALGPEMVEKIYGAIESNLMYDKIEGMLLEDGRIEASAQQFAEGVSKALGERWSAADVMAALDDADILSALEAELPKAKTSDDIHTVFSDVESRMQAYINELHKLDIVQKAREVAEAVKIGDLTGIHDTWVDLNARMSEWWTSHVIEWGNVIQESDSMFADGHTDAANALYKARLETAKAEANRIMEMQISVIDGLVDGLRETGVDVSQKYPLGLRTQLAEWRKFFDIRDALWESYGNDRLAGTLETGRYTEIINELQGRYLERIADDLDLQGIMDAELVSATARVNMQSATALQSTLDAIRVHKATIYAEEAVVRQAGHELWNLTTGAEAANVLLRNFAGHPDLLKAFETTIRRWKQRTTDVNTKDLRSFRRILYDVWSRDVKIQHIKDYYLIRSEGMLEVTTDQVQPVRPDAQQPEPVRVDSELEVAEAEVTRLTELLEGGIEPDEAGRIAAEKAAGEVMNVDYSRATTIEELRTRANDAGISTATKDGRPFDGHLINVLNKDLGLNDTPLKLRTLDDLTTLVREGGAPGDSLAAARQALVNRGANRLRAQQEGRITGLTVEALETLDAGIDSFGLRKLRRVAKANGLTEADLMPKEHIWSWLNARRNRLRPTPFEAASPDAIKQQIREAMDRVGYPGEEVSDAAVAIFEARAKAIGMTMPEFLEFRMGLDNPDIIYSFSQMEGRPSVWVDRARKLFGITEDPAKGFWLLRDGKFLDGTKRPGLDTYSEGGLRLEHGEVDRAVGLKTEEFGEATGSIRWQTGLGGPIAEFFTLPTIEQMTVVNSLIRKAGKGTIEFAGGTVPQRLEVFRRFNNPTVEELSGFWARAEEALSKHTTTFFQDPDLHRPFYSHLSRVLENKMPQRMQIEEFRNFLKRQGVKPTEFKWSGIEEYLELQEAAGRAASPQFVPVIEKSTVQAVARDLTPTPLEALLPEAVQPVQLAEIEWKYPTQAGFDPAVSANEMARPPHPSWANGFRWRLVEVSTVRAVNHPGSSVTHKIFDFYQGAPEAPYPQAQGKGQYMLETLTTDDITPSFPLLAVPDVDVGARADASGRHLQLFESVEEAKSFAQEVNYETVPHQAKWESVTYPGGNNYREVIMHLPERQKTVKGLLDKIDEAFLKEVTTTIEGQPRPSLDTAIQALGFEIIRRNYTGPEFPGVAQAVVNLETYMKTLGYNPDAVTIENVTKRAIGVYTGAPGIATQGLDYKSPHWSEPNVVSHMRFKDRFTADGRKLLFIEELQSDWGQLWRDMRGRQRGVEAEGREFREVGRQVPPMPWEKTWPEMSMRRAMRMAAEEGYEGLAWNTGDGMYRTETGSFPADTVMDFDMVQLVHVEEGGPRGDGYYDLNIWWDGQKHTNVGLTRGQAENMIGHDTLLQLENISETGTFEGSDGARYVHYDFSDAEGGTHTHTALPQHFEGVERYTRMRKGMNTFYDEVIPNFMRKEVKKWGAQVEMVDFQSGITAATRIEDIGTSVGRFRNPTTAKDIFVRARGDFSGAVFETWFEVADSLEALRSGPNSMIQDVGEMRIKYPWMTGDELSFIQELPNSGYSPGHVVWLTDAMRDSTMFEGQKLFQQGSDSQVRAAELEARQALSKAINAEGLGVTTLSRLLEGTDIAEVFAHLTEIPSDVFTAYRAWEAARADGQWLDGQTRMFQGPKGSTEIGRDGRAIMRFMKNADPSTVLHEIGHIFRLDLQPSELDVVVDWLRKTVRNHDGVDVRQVDLFEGKFTGDEGVPRAAEEAFARGFERYVAEGVAPTEGLKGVFEKFRRWLLEIYRSIKGSGIDIELSEGMRSLYADMLGGRAPDFDIHNVTWQTTRTDAIIRGQPEVSEPMVRSLAVDLPPASARLTGQTGATTTAHGADPAVNYDFVYRVMPLEDITPSHTIEGNLSKGYPKKLQPRDRSRAASVRQSQAMAADLYPGILLDPIAKIDDGAPIIGPDGLVESGSGRVNALRIARLDFPENYASYKAMLLEHVRNGTYGDIDVATIGDNPVLVRERLTDLDRFEFSRLANESSVLGTSAAEQASMDVAKISDRMLNNLIISEGQTVQDALKTTANQDLVRQFVEKSPRSDQAVLLTSDGEITRQGMDRILAAIFQYVYGDYAGGLRLAENVFEATDPVILNITNGMMQAAGDMAKAEALIRAGRRPETLSITNDLSAAVEKLLSLKQEGAKTADFVDQGALEGFGVDISEFQMEILLDLEVGKRSAKAIRDLLQTYARLVIQEPDIGQMGLLGAHEYPTAQQMWTRAKDSPAPTAELFQLPEQYKMRGYFDQTPGIQESGAKSAEGFRNMLSIMDELREQMAGPEGYVQEIRSESIRERLAPDQQAEFKQWTKELRSQLSGTKFSAVKWGEDVRNYALLDYTALRGIDTNFLGIPFNYAFWPTRTIMRWALRFMEYPALLAGYARINEARRKQEERPGFPRRLQGKMYLPIPWMQEWMGDGLWIDPIRQFFPPHMFMDNIDRIATAENRLNKRTARIIQKQVESGETHPQDAQEALQTRAGPLWEFAVDIAKNEQEQEFKDPLDYLSIVTGLALPISIAHDVLRGTPERIHPLPLTRYTKTATSMFAQMTGIGDPEGINIEGPIREAFDLPNWDRFEDYRVDRMLATQMGDDPSRVRELLIAGQEKTGPAFEEAVRRVNAARNFGIYANPAFWIFGLGGDTFPTGEVQQRNLSKEFGLAITAREIGDSTAINRFFEKYPEYEGRLASFDSQEERMRFFLVDEFWVKYRELGSANKELVRKQLGQGFNDLFLNKETRNYADIPLETLAAWVNLVGGYVPKNAENRIEVKEQEPLLQLPPQFAKVIDDFRATRKQKFPNWFAVQQGYFAAGPRKSDERKAYLKKWPELEEYWDWKDDQFESSEFLNAYQERYDLESSDKGRLGSLGIADIVTNPILVRQLMAERYGGQALTTGALEELRRIYDILQQPGGNFKEWIGDLDFEEQGAYGTPENAPRFGEHVHQGHN